MAMTRARTLAAKIAIPLFAISTVVSKPAFSAKDTIFTKPLVSYCKNLKKGDSLKLAGRIKEGEELIREGKTAAAIDQFTEIISENPFCAKAYAGRGNAYLYAGLGNMALDDLKSAVELEKENPSYRVLYAAALLESRFIGNAIEQLGEAIRITPKAELYYERAGLYAMKQMKKMANADLGKAIEIYEADLQGADSARAILCYAKLVKISGERAEILMSLGKKKDAAKEYGRAVKWAKKMAIRLPEDYDAQMALGQAHSKMARFFIDRKKYREALKEDISAYYAYSRSYDLSSSDNDAVEWMTNTCYVLSALCGIVGNKSAANEWFSIYKSLREKLE
jgi:tetratricopeptide (TPR) repeat protein